jgi:penicillin amidase
VKQTSPAKIFLFSINLLITVVLTIVMQQPQGSLPPPGKFFDPFGGFWQNAEGPLHFKSGEMHIQGLKGAVYVNFDERMVPRIFAENTHDLYFMQGYICARFRLWQMDMQSRAAAGRLSEVAGEKTLQTDQLTRRLGLPDAAKRSAAFMMSDPASKEILEAYAAGVNARINELLPAEYPLEFKLLNYQPEPWSPYKTALLLKYMANLLTSYENDFENTNAVNRFGENVFQTLFPVFPDTLLDPVIPIGTAFSKPVLSPLAPVTLPDSIRTTAMYAPSAERPEPDLGSNNWAVAGSRTQSGKPILSNDPHLPLNLPSIWFEVQLNSPEQNVYGVSIPGAPCVISGFNDSIAWGITNAAMDVKDWYDIQFRDASRNEYLSDGKWLKTKKVLERIVVKGRPPVYDTIVYTHYGPLTYDAWFHHGNTSANLALRWTAHEPGNELLTFHQLNRAANYKDYTEALSHYVCPGQNFVFASASGDIAIRQQGLFVNRYPDQGRFILDGTRSSTAWQGFIPDSANPAVLNPPRAWVSSANQHPTDSTWPYHYHGIYEYYRNRRINSLLAGLNKARPEDMMQIQNDNFNLYARESLPMLLRNLDIQSLSKDDRQAVGYLLKWDYLNAPGQVAPVYFEAWWKHFTELLWDEFQADGEVLVKPGTFQTIRYLQHFPENQFTDIKATTEKENLQAICRMSYLAAIQEVRHWQSENQSKPLAWAWFKNTNIQHLTRQKAFSVGNLFIGGNSGIVNACSNKNGPSWRMIVSPGTQGAAYGVYPGGQSGNPGSRYYDNFINTWVNGKYFKIRMLRKDEQAKRILYLIYAKG